MALVFVKYGIDNPAAKLKLDTATRDDEVVLLQNGIYWVLEDVQERTRGKVSVLKEDLLARGYPENATQCPLIDYNGLVKIIEKEARFIG